MAGFSRIVALAFWILGLLTTIVAIVGRLITPLRSMLEDRIELRSLLWLAGVLFLGAIATRAIGRPSNA